MMLFRAAWAIPAVYALNVGAAPPKAGVTAMPSVEVALVGVNVTDLDRSIEFYTTVLGLSVIARYDDHQSGGEVVLGAPAAKGDFRPKVGGSIVLVWKPNTNAPLQMGTTFSRVGITTDDAKGLIQRVKAAGFQVVQDAKPVGSTAILVGVVKDPDGIPIEVIQPVANGLP